VGAAVPDQDSVWAAAFPAAVARVAEQEQEPEPADLEVAAAVLAPEGSAVEADLHLTLEICGALPGNLVGEAAVLVLAVVASAVESVPALAAVEQVPAVGAGPVLAARPVRLQANG
jgi:hypothetical protein